MRREDGDTTSIDEQQLGRLELGPAVVCTRAAGSASTSGSSTLRTEVDVDRSARPRCPRARRPDSNVGEAVGGDLVRAGWGWATRAGSRRRSRSGARRPGSPAGQPRSTRAIAACASADVLDQPRRSSAPPPESHRCPSSSGSAPVVHRSATGGESRPDRRQRQQGAPGRADLDLGAHRRADPAVEARRPAAVVDSSPRRARPASRPRATPCPGRSRGGPRAAPRSRSRSRVVYQSTSTGGSAARSAAAIQRS